SNREPHTIGSDVREMLENDLQLEHNNAKTLREVIEYCEEVDDYVTREMLVGILKDTEEDHAYWLQIQLNLMDRLGEQLYLQSMM
ncbi:MAG TPA: bacterioferritin, partial [Idiomarina loihiensis]|nr:bacterioferritin [Idiomarina loihiensis]